MPNTDLQSRAAIVRAMFAAVDGRDAEGLIGFLTDDIVLVFAHNAPVEGKQAFDTTNRQFMSAIGGIRHEIHDLWQAAEDPDVVIARMTVHYTRLDGSGISLPCCNVFRMRGDLIADYRVYMDINPVFA
jgi:ketosteroid isomerase-like protein